ncbi:MAG: AIM24 family protein [Thermoproteus sp.]
MRITASTGGGILAGLKRALTGASFFVLELEGPGYADLAGFAPGKIVEIDLNGGGILAEHRSFLAMESSVNYDVKLVGLGFGWLGGEGLLMARLYGTGKVFLHVIGDALTFELGPGQSIDVEAGHVLAFEEGVKVGIRRVGGLKTMLFGEEGLWFAHVEGPGRVWLRILSRPQLIMGLMPELAKVARSA